MKNRLRNRAAMTVEAVLILAVISLPIIIVLGLFTQKIIGWFNEQAGQLQP